MKLFDKDKQTLTEEEKDKKFWDKLKRTMATTSKQLVWIFSLNAIIWIYCSYVLAFMGKEQIAESLSSNVCSVIIGELCLYLVTSTVESIFKYNEFSFSRHKHDIIEPAVRTKNGGMDFDPSMIGPDEEFSEPVG